MLEHNQNELDQYVSKWNEYWMKRNCCLCCILFKSHNNTMTQSEQNQQTEMTEMTEIQPNENSIMDTKTTTNITRIKYKDVSMISDI